MIQKISRSGHTVAKKENGYIVEGQLPEELLAQLHDLIEGWTSPDEEHDAWIAERIPKEYALRYKEQYEFWKPGVKYEPGQRRRYELENGEIRLYEVREGKGHTSQVGWEPDKAVSEWYDLEGNIPTEEGGVPDWSPTATYLTGDRVRHNGFIWESTHPHPNVGWEPGGENIDERIWKKVG